MCAIVGFNRKNKDNILDDMLEEVRHRGPDDRGIYEDELVSLGHNRLSILDLSSHGHQPMKFENLVITYNGEIYNFREIKEELILLGYDFFSETDTEVVLKAYHAWGIKSVDKFIGMFAVVIYDKTKQELVIIRDRAGVKPLYYYIKDDEFVFASELKPIILYKNNLSIDRTALQEYFQLGYISRESTIFKNCFKLLAGHYGVYDLKINKLSLNQYWSILPYFDKENFQKTEDELVDELEELLISACLYRTVSDVPIGVFLSGGIDSAIVAAILQKHHGVVHTFTVGFKEESYNEAEPAKRLAEYIGSIHKEKVIDSKIAGHIFERYVKIYDEPFGDYSGIPTTMVSEMAKEKGIKVVLSGDGGDEIFCGYSHYNENFKIGIQIFKIPLVVRRLMSFLKIGYLKKVVKIEGLPNRYGRLDNILGLLMGSTKWIDLHIRSLLKYDNKIIKKLLSTSQKIQPGLEIPDNLHPIEQMMLHDYHIPLVDNIVAKVDRATMSVSIEGREPLLDHRIAEFMAQVPIKFKYKNGDKKYLLKKVLERYVPPSMIERPKRGFGIPMLEWFGGDLKYMFYEHFSIEELQRHGFFRVDFVRSQYKRLLNSKNVNVSKLWLVLVFQMWYERYISKRN
jgi:asparagine synthase (glutamine-hydrolysing)